jgi:hypothetical protein
VEHGLSGSGNGELADSGAEGSDDGGSGAAALHDLSGAHAARVDRLTTGRFELLRAMGCLFAIFAGAFPRIAVLFMWLARPQLFLAALQRLGPVTKLSLARRNAPARYVEPS